MRRTVRMGERREERGVRLRECGCTAKERKNERNDKQKTKIM